MFYVDTETCGLHGMAVLIQYAEDDGEICLHNVWKEPIYNTLRIIEAFLDEGIIGFNLAFDMFHLCKLHTTFTEFIKRNPTIDPEWEYPEDHINEMAICEEAARFGNCLKPKHAFDLMLHARKGPFQSLMAREDIKVRKVPTSMAYLLAKELESRVQIENIYFSGKSNPMAPKWNIYPYKDRSGVEDNDFKNVVLKFASSRSLKTLAHYALKVENTLKFHEIELAKKLWPRDVGYAPFALAISSAPTWKVDDGWSWPGVIQHHIDHWAYNVQARQYATDDVTYTRGLYKYFNCPPVDDDDSILACMVAAVRWTGFHINIDGIKNCRTAAIKVCKSAPRSPARARVYIESAMSNTEKLAFVGGSTKKTVLQAVEKWKVACACIKFPTINGVDSSKTSVICPYCRGTGEVIHPAAQRSKEVLEARKAEKEVELYDKLLLAGRFHASFVIIGSLSSRMAGGDDLNAQGINHSNFVRENFDFVDNSEYTFCGGDFDSFEIAIADAVYNDPVMHSDLQKGIKLHAVMGASIFGETIEQILATKGDKVYDKYDIGKKGNFLLIYGGNANTFETKLGISVEKGEEAFMRFFQRYPTFGKNRREKMNKFCSMTQPGGIGTEVKWKDPAPYAESLMGFKRYFTLENMICKALFDLSQKPPKEWKDIKIKVQRRDRIQSASGATQSALYAAAFGLQGANMRAGLNHEVQSTGATITKRLQRNIWTVQPFGVHEFIVKPMNVHDEVNCPTKVGHESAVNKVVDETVASFKSMVPEIKMAWKIGLKTWADK